MRDEIKIFATSLINKNLEEAHRLCVFNNYVIRVIEKDGEAYMQTMDLKFNRINVRVKNNIIYDISLH
jgi:hypothetical protein